MFVFRRENEQRTSTNRSSLLGSTRTLAVARPQVFFRKSLLATAVSANKFCLLPVGEDASRLAPGVVGVNSSLPDTGGSESGGSTVNAGLDMWQGND